MSRFFIQRDDGKDFKDVDLQQESVSMIIEGLLHVEAEYWRKGLRNLADGADSLRQQLEKLRDAS